VMIVGPGLPDAALPLCALFAEMAVRAPEQPCPTKRP